MKSFFTYVAVLVGLVGATVLMPRPALSVTGIPHNEVLSESTCAIWMVDLDDGLVNACSATLIQDDILVSAAQCMKHYAPEKGHKFFAKCKDRSDKIFNATIIQSKAHASFSFEHPVAWTYDVLVVKIDQKFPLPTMKRVSGIDETKRLLQEQTCYFAGWGRASDGKSYRPNAVQTPSGYALVSRELVPVLAQKLPTWDEIRKGENQPIFIRHGGWAYSYRGLDRLSDVNTQSGGSVGDSGGPLYCVDSAHGNQSVLLGMMTRATRGLIETTSILVGDPELSAWIDRTAKELSEK